MVQHYLSVNINLQVCANNIAILELETLWIVRIFVNYIINFFGQNVYNKLIIDAYSPNSKRYLRTFYEDYFDHWPVSFLYNLNPTTGYASVYMQPLRCDNDLCIFITTDAS